MANILVVHGPNLNLLGTREVDIYGGEAFDGFLKKMHDKYPDLEISYYQSNVEGELINEIQKVGYSCDGIILNPGGYTHTSVALGDAIAAIITPVIEIHISNIFGREDFRKLSHVSGKSVGVISGLGLRGYELAVTYFLGDKA